MTHAFAVQTLMAAFFLGTIAVIPIGWYFLGRKTYGTGDYNQP
ncbi:MAG: hypothetical protein ACLPSH_00020 [Vulcanimicrobiaceae bacterium]